MDDLVWAKNLSLAGKNVFVEAEGEPGTPAELGEKAKQSQTKLQEWFKAHGYSVVPTRKTAHLFVTISTGYEEPLVLTEDNKIKTQKTRYLPDSSIQFQSLVPDENSRVYTMSIAGRIQSYGQRGTPLFSTGASSGSKNILAELIDSQTEALVKTLPGLQVAEAKEKKSNQPPGCRPTFGYKSALRFSFGGMELKSMWEKEDRDVTVIYEVVKGSAAEKAGLKAGDQLLAIDSKPVSEFYADKSADKVYNERIAVPIKYLRDGKELRSTIRAQIVCD